MHLPPPQDPREIVGRQKESVVVENLHPRYSKGQPIKPPQQPPPPFAVPPPNANLDAYKLNYFYPHNITYSVVGADLNSVQVTEAEVLSTEVINVVSHDPYPGLRPYEESEKDNFFGRDAERSIVLDKLLVQRLTLLFAASGVGKSSLLNAAVLPQLKDPFGENLTVICYRDWVIQPIEGLCSAVREAIPAASQYPGAANLVDLLRFCCLFTRHPVILILDQFEEFFRYQSGKEDYPALIEQLTALILNPALPVNVLVSMREDFALELNAFKPKLPSLLFENYYRLERMTPAAARVAILEPVEPWGFGYEPALLEALLQDLGQRESHGVNSLNETRWIEPPYLQIVCARLWALNKDNAERVLKLSSYVQAGGAKGILKKFLVQALAKFSRAEKQIASQTFDYLTAQRGVKMAYPLEVLAKITGLKPARLASVLDKLAGSEVRILRTQQRAEVTWYELYHDLFSESVNDWNYTYKKWRRRQYLCLASIEWLLILAVVLLLLESFLWVKNNRFPVEYMLQKQKFYLMHWGVLPEPLPKMVEIPVPRGRVTIGEYTSENGQVLSDWMRQNKLYNQQNFGYPTVKVKLTNAFFMSKYEITYEQYDYYVWQQHRVGVNPKELLYPKSRWNVRNNSIAVTQVSWGEAVAYTRWLSAKTGKNYRLPTEVEWEYAARAGTQTAYWWGDNSLNGEKDTEGKDRAHCGNCGSQWEYNSTPYIGRYPANPWGLHDTAGNVWEWTCSAWRVRLDAQASLCAAEDNQDGRVLRGGSWSSSTVWLRSAARFRNSVNDQRSDVGFRVVQLSNAP